MIRKKIRRRNLSITFAPPKLRFNTLGREQIFVDNKLLDDWQASTLREFIISLLAHPQGMTKEQVGLLFWPDCSPGQLKMRFKKTIYRLRRILGQEVVVFQQDRYLFNRAIDYEYDVDQFWEYIEKASHESDMEQKIRFWQKAVELYRGEFLSGWDANWVILERERIWQAYVNATIQISKYYYENGELTRSLELSQGLLKEDACIEAAHRILMRIYNRRGQQNLVVQQYLFCQNALQEELGVSPSQRTIQLFSSLTS